MHELSYLKLEIVILKSESIVDRMSVVLYAVCERLIFGLRVESLIGRINILELVRFKQCFKLMVCE